MNRELETIASRLACATTVEEVFGDAPTTGPDLLPQVRKSYLAMVRVTHPDLYSNPDEQVLAQTTLERLLEWFKTAQNKIRSGTYGQKDDGQTTITLQTKKRSYQVENTYEQDDIFNTYPCSFDENGHTRLATLKLVRAPKNNTLAQNEFSVLQTLQSSSEATKYSPYLPIVFDAFTFREGGQTRQALVFERLDGWFSLEAIRSAYPGGIDPKDMAWIWRRLLTVLGFAHRAGVIHAAVNPANVLILPDQHGLMLVNWSLATPEPSRPWEHASHIHPAYRAWASSELLTGGRLHCSADLLMSAKCMLYLLGGDPATGAMPGTAPAALRTFFKGSLLPGRKAPQDAWALKRDFDECITRLWGLRKYHPFTMNF